MSVSLLKWGDRQSGGGAGPRYLAVNRSRCKPAVRGLPPGLHMSRSPGIGHACRYSWLKISHDLPLQRAQDPACATCAVPVPDPAPGGGVRGRGRRGGVHEGAAAGGKGGRSTIRNSVSPTTGTLLTQCSLGLKKLFRATIHGHTCLGIRVLQAQKKSAVSRRITVVQLARDAITQNHKPQLPSSASLSCYLARSMRWPAPLHHLLAAQVREELNKQGREIAVLVEGVLADKAIEEDQREQKRRQKLQQQGEGAGGGRADAGPTTVEDSDKHLQMLTQALKRLCTVQRWHIKQVALGSVVQPAAGAEELAAWRSGAVMAVELLRALRVTGAPMRELIVGRLLVVEVAVGDIKKCVPPPAAAAAEAGKGSKGGTKASGKGSKR